MVHLHVHSNYSLLDGGSTVEALVERARATGMAALALTDHDGLYGAVRFHRAATAAGIRPIIGVEMTLEALPDDAETRRRGDAGTAGPPPPCVSASPRLRVSASPAEEGREYHIVLLARSRQGFRSLCRLITEAQLAYGKGRARLSLETLNRCRAGLIGLSGCERGEVASLALQGQPGAAVAAARRFREIFEPGAFAIEVQNLLHPHSPTLMRALAAVAREAGLPLVATNDVHYATKDVFPVHDCLTCVRTLTTLDEGHPARKQNAEYYLKSPRAMARLFTRYSDRGPHSMPSLHRVGCSTLPEAVRETERIAAMCEESMELGVYHFPDFPIPPDETHYSFLCKLCWDGARDRYRTITPDVMRRLEHELDVIDRLGFAQYFLVMWDIVRFARERGIRCAGRGSAADSIVTYVLGITHVDPIAHGLLFERFLNPERKGAPDIDIDFDANRRDEVIHYVYEKYGREHAAMVCTVNTYHAKSAVRDLGKALDFPPEDIDQFAKALPHTRADGIRAALDRLPELRDAGFPTWKLGLLLDLCEQIAGFPRHLGVHLGGTVVSQERLDELVPLEWSTKGVVVTQWDKDDVEEVGLVKMDLLSLKNLAAIEDALRTLRETHGIELAIDHLPLDDPETFALLRSTHTVGVFQVESPGMRGLLGRLQPEVFEDLIAQISLFRPGPLTAEMIDPFINRRHGREPVRYDHPKLEPILRGTYGVILYQEQVLEIASALAGFTLGQADSLRRAMTTDRSPQEMEKIRQSFLDGAVAQGVAPAVAERVWKSLSAFAAYGFCKAHAAAFAKTSYQTAYLKAHYPAEFFTGILNNQPMGFYSSHTILQEARRLGIPVLPVDVNASRGEFTVETVLGVGCWVLGREQAQYGTATRRSHSPQHPTPNTQHPTGIRVGLKQVKGMSEADLAAIAAARADGPFVSLEDFCRRTHVPRDVVQNLILCGAFESLDPSRRRLLWQLEEALRSFDDTTPSEAGQLALGLAPGHRAGVGCRVSGVGENGFHRHPTPDTRHPTPEATLYEMVRWEIETLGLSLRAHPTRLFRAQLAPYRPVPACRLAQQTDGARVATAGVVVCRMRPRTKSGAVVVFITLEDETGLIDTVVFPRVYDHYGKAAFAFDLLVIEGRIQRHGKYGSTLVAEKIFNPLEGLVADRIDGKTGLAKRTLEELPAFTFAPEEVEEEWEE